MMTRGGEGGKKCRKFDDVICERPLTEIGSETDVICTTSDYITASESLDRGLTTFLKFLYARHLRENVCK